MTKKILLAMSAITMLFATSCEKTLSPDVAVGETSTVSFNIGTPEMVTRAYSDGATATVLQYAVYDETGAELTDLRKTDAEIHGSTTVEFQLTTGNTYSVIFWAAAPNAPYSVDFTNKKMTVNYANAVSNDESRDAFYVYHTFTVSGTQTEKVVLKRPFAQLNIGTNDYAASKSAGYEPKYSFVKVPVSSELNLVTGAVDAAAEVEFKLADIPTGETFPVRGYEYLAMNYLLVGAEKEVVDVTFGYSENNNGAEKTRTVGSVPVQRNYRTNIYGQLLTSDVDVNVEINPDYNEPSHVADALYLAAAVGGEYTLTEDVILPETLNVQSNMVLNLNGKTLTNDVNNTKTDVIVVEKGATLTIEGEGNITAVTGNDGYAVISKGTVIINGGTFQSGRDAANDVNAVVYASGNGKVYVNGGTFLSDDTDRYVLNKKDADRATTTIEVRGGSFQNFNPADNAAEGAGTNFCADGYTVIETDVNGTKYYSVVPVGETYENPIVSAEQLKALSGTQVSGTYNLLADIDMTGIDMKPIMLKSGADNSLVFNGNGHTIKNLNLIQDYQNGMYVAGLFNILHSGKEITVKDLAIVNATSESDKYAAVVLAYNSTSATINLDNVDVDGATIEAETVSPLVSYTTGPVNLTNCDVKNITMTGEAPEKIGAFVGTANTSTCVVTTTNCVNSTSYNDYGRVINGATWNGVNIVSTATELYNLATATGDVKIALAKDITLGNDTDVCNAVNFANATSVTIDGGNKTITFKGKAGNKSDTSIDRVAGILSVGDITIKNVTLVNDKLSYFGTETSADRIQVYTTIRGASVAYEKVTFNGGVQVKGNESFIDCEFTESVLTTNAEGYATDGRFCMFIDHEYDTTGEWAVKLENCTFNASGYGCVKVAGDKGAKITVDVKGCSFTNTCPSNSWSQTTPKYDVKATGANVTVKDLGGNTWTKGLA